MNAKVRRWQTMPFKWLNMLQQTICEHSYHKQLSYSEYGCYALVLSTLHFVSGPCYDVLPVYLPSDECRATSHVYLALQVTAGLQHPASPRQPKATLTSGPHL